MVSWRIDEQQSGNIEFLLPDERTADLVDVIDGYLGSADVLCDRTCLPGLNGRPPYRIQ